MSLIPKPIARENISTLVLNSASSLHSRKGILPSVTSLHLLCITLIPHSIEALDSNAVRGIIGNVVNALGREYSKPTAAGLKSLWAVN